MIERVVAAAVQRRNVTIGLTLVLAAAAGVTARQVRLDALPDVTNNQVLVLTRVPGLTPEEVERTVTRPIEAAMGGLPGLHDHRSISRYGISSVTLIFEDDVDVYRARQLTQEKLLTLGGALPPGIDTPELGPITGGLGEIFHFTVSSPQRTAAELFELVQLKIAPRLRAVAGVVEVNTWGGQRRAHEIVADPVRLAQRGSTLARLRAALEDSFGARPGASLPSGNRQVLLRAVARPADLSALGLSLIPTDRGPVRLADVASLREGELPRIGAATASGGGETIYVMAQMLRGENALEVVHRIHTRMTEVAALLPEDVRIELVYDRSVLVGKALATVGRNLLEGGALVLVVLFLMLGSLRAGLLVAAVIPLSMLGAAVGMVVFDIPGNLMSLGAIDFGLIVDGAVVMVEHVFHRLKDEQDPARFRARVGEVTREVASPVFFAVLVIMLVYLPVLTLTGVDGKMFRPMALTVVFALFTSLVLSLTFVPAVASIGLRPRDIPARDPLLVRGLVAAYAAALHRVRRHPLWVVGAALLLFVGGAVLFVRSGSEFTPQLDEGDLVVQTARAPEISLAEANAQAGRMERALLAAAPEVTQVVTRTGSPAVATDIMGIEQADVFVQLRPTKAWRKGLSRDRLIESLRSAIEAATPGSDPAFTQPIQMRFNELLGGAVSDVTVSVYGDDLVELRRLAEAVAASVRKERGAVDVRLLAPDDVTLLEVRPRPLAAAQLGFSSGDLLALVQAIKNGLEVGATYEGPLRVPIMLRSGTQVTAADLAAMPIATADGGVIPLSRIAEVSSSRAPSAVQHERGERRILVGLNIRGADLGDVVGRASARVGREVAVPRGYVVTWGGQFETLRAAQARIALVIPAVIGLILLVLLVAFRKVRPALIILTHVPFAGVGGIAALALRGMPISMSAAIGFIALGGVAVLNGVVLMSRVVHNEAAGLAPSEAAVAAALARARPVLMTALVAALGFVPMMLATGVGAEVQRPLATVVVGGLVTSTGLTLFLLPTLYPWLRLPRRKQKPVVAQA